MDAPPVHFARGIPCDGSSGPAFLKYCFHQMYSTKMQTCSSFCLPFKALQCIPEFQSSPNWCGVLRNFETHSCGHAFPLGCCPSYSKRLPRDTGRLPQDTKRLSQATEGLIVTGKLSQATEGPPTKHCPKMLRDCPKTLSGQRELVSHLEPLPVRRGSA